MRAKTISILFLIFFLIVSSSYSQQKTEWLGKIEYEDGVKVIKNSIKPIYSKYVLHLEEDLSIGEVAGKEEYMFSRISGISVDREERIYVLDYSEANIKVFNKNGDYLKTIGRKGQGPWEMTSPFSICITKKNEIVVQDLNNHQISFFSLEGRYLKAISTAELIIVGSVIDTRGNIIRIISTTWPDTQIVELKKFNSELDYLYSFCSFSLPRRSPAYNPFNPEICWALTVDDEVFCGYSENYEIKVFSSDGKLIRIIRKDYEPVRITPEEIERIKKTLPGPMRLDIPKNHAAYRDLTIDEEGRCYVRSWEKDPVTKGYYLDIFDSEGIYIAKVPIEVNLNRSCVWKRNRLYTIEEDEEGFQVVKRYKVTQKY
ncbi:MAG: 6-bladed beta-propeller [Candidatus Aminicenantes bacterium]|nr:6-bladed beta-propeller [Candidatus Aminicenantes bacterium]